MPMRRTCMWLRNDPKRRSIGSKTWMTAPFIGVEGRKLFHACFSFSDTFPEILLAFSIAYSTNGLFLVSSFPNNDKGIQAAILSKEESVIRAAVTG